MYIDLTVTVTAEHRAMAGQYEDKVRYGHLGTHFDVMDKEFPLEYLKRQGIVMDISHVEGRDIDMGDLDLGQVEQGMFVALHSGLTDRMGYGSKEYFKNHPQLSYPLIQALLDKEVSIIGLDFAGIRRGEEHPPADQTCADRNTFVVENLCNLGSLLNGQQSAPFTAHTYPIKFEGMTGLACRVVAEPDC